MPETAALQSNDIVVNVNDLCVHFPIRKGLFGAVAGFVKAVDGISFAVRHGEIFALVGESGCGKTTTAQAIAGLLPATSGSIDLSFDNMPQRTIDWKSADAAAAKAVRRRMQMIFQDPYSSLNPRMTVKAILEEPLIIHHLGSRDERDRRIRALLDRVGLSHEYLNRYPHEFSGGQRQRIGIARALATDPRLIIADEPVSALDVSIQAQIINLMQDLRTGCRQTQLFISHDLAVVRHMADRIAVMYRGKFAEYGSESDLFLHPCHPYTILLLDSIPVPGKGRKQRGGNAAEEIDRQPEVAGCAFYPRCPRRLDKCRATVPELREVKKGHGVACFNPAGEYETT
ncbi:MAG: ABC transporter ATP-binding protein [Chitinispirillaceae bacterium]|nr:ABC transporter ATP-binding protein [Chitinispirillaceae bacterium]